MPGKKNNIEAEIALGDLNKSIGTSEFNLTEIVPEELKSSLPTIEEIEKEFNGMYWKKFLNVQITNKELEAF